MSTLDMKPSSVRTSFGFEPDNVQQPKTKHSQSTEATEVDSCPELQPLTHQSHCLELHRLLEQQVLGLTSLKTSSNWSMTLETERPRGTWCP